MLRIKAFDIGARRIAIGLLAAPIHAYRLALSPLTPPACRFHPTCSAYALEALREHGPVRGIALALRRLARCHPVKWLGGGEGFDPVPPSKTLSEIRKP
jgi:putative membrane protein insertion efficiency factor